MSCALSLHLDTACRSEPHLEVLQPNTISHSLRLALAPREALLGAGMGTDTAGLAPHSCSTALRPQSTV